MHYPGEVGNIYTTLWKIYSGLYVQKFYQNQTGFVDDVIKTFWSIFVVHSHSSNCRSLTKREH